MTSSSFPTAKPHKPAFESLHRSVGLRGELITGFKVTGVRDREPFVSLQETCRTTRLIIRWIRDGFVDFRSQGCALGSRQSLDHGRSPGIDEHVGRRHLHAWCTYINTSLGLELNSQSVRRSEWQAFSRVRAAWPHTIRSLRKITNNILTLESSRQVVSVAGENKETVKKLEQSRQMGLDLDSTESIPT